MKRCGSAEARFVKTKVDKALQECRGQGWDGQRGKGWVDEALQECRGQDWEKVDGAKRCGSRLWGWAERWCEELRFPALGLGGGMAQRVGVPSGGVGQRCGAKGCDSRR